MNETQKSTSSIEATAKSMRDLHTIRNKPKIGRNDICDCGCGRKFKVCVAEKRETAERLARDRSMKQRSRISTGKALAFVQCVASIN